MQSHPKLVLLIGAPSTGKTSVIDGLIELGYQCFEEVSREIVLEAREQGISHLFKQDPLLFSEKLLEKRIEQYHKARKIGEDFVFIDRGLPDITAYLDMVNTRYNPSFDDAIRKCNYDIVFWFPLWKDIYTADNERYEDLELSKKIQKALLKTYKSLKYDLVEVPKLSVKERVTFMLSYLQNHE